MSDTSRHYPANETIVVLARARSSAASAGVDLAFHVDKLRCAGLLRGTVPAHGSRRSIIDPADIAFRDRDGGTQPVRETRNGFESSRSSFTNALAETSPREFALRVNRREDFVDVSSVHFGAFQG